VANRSSHHKIINLESYVFGRCRRPENSVESRTIRKPPTSSSSHPERCGVSRMGRSPAQQLRDYQKALAYLGMRPMGVSGAKTPRCLRYVHTEATPKRTLTERPQGAIVDVA
jgi:hypothetical protein